MRDYRVLEFTSEQLKNPNFSENRPLFTTQNEWTIVKYIMEVLRPFWYWMHWMSKRNTVTVHHVITVYNDMFDHMDGIMRDLRDQINQCKQDLYIAVKFARQKLSTYYTEATPVMGMLLISAHIHNAFRILQSVRMWDKGIDINSDDETSYAIQSQEAFLKYVENEYCAKYWCLPVTKHKSVPSNNLCASPMASRSVQTSDKQYDLTSDNEGYLMPNNVTETMPRRSNCAAHLPTAERLYLNSPSQWPQNWWQIDPNHNDYHSDPTQSNSTYCIPDITDWWHQQEKIHSKSADLSNVAHDIISII